jgi:hypothetical protein
VQYFIAQRIFNISTMFAKGKQFTHLRMQMRFTTA